MWITRYKNEISSIQSLVSIFALLVGGAWVIWNFDFQSEHVPQLSVSQEVTKFSVGEDITLLKITDKLRNEGKKTGVIKCVSLYAGLVLPLSTDNLERVRHAIQAENNPSLDIPSLHNFSYRENPTVVPARGESAWWVYIFVPNYLPQSKERNKLIVITTKFFDDSKCDGKEQIEETSMVDISPN